MPAPDILYHYTSQAGLQGILASDCIWATDIYALNDWTEFRLLFTNTAMQLLVDTFSSELPDDINADAKKMMVERVLAERNFPTILEIIKADPPYGDRKGIFVCSLTGVGDLLSQWRGYSHSSQGFSLGFDTALLKKQLKAVHTLDTPTELVECIYDETRVRKRIRDLGRKAAKGFRELKKRKEVVPASFRTLQNPSTKYREHSFYLEKSFTFATVPFLRLAAQFKHHGFQEEREWRVLFRTFFKTLPSDKLKFRSGPFGPTSYVEIPLGLRSPVSCSLRRIIIGPRTYCGHERKDMINSVELLLSKYSIPVKSSAEPNGVEIATSEIPYRSA
jgi:Protein of unknown function (DUF2971)